MRGVKKENHRLRPLVLRVGWDVCLEISSPEDKIETASCGMGVE